MGTNRGACCCRHFSETQVKAVRKRCILGLDLKDVRDGENPHTIKAHDTGKTLHRRFSS